MIDMNAPISKSTARDMVNGILKGIEEIPTFDRAREISDEYLLRGCYIRPEYLMDVWLEIWETKKEL